MNNEEKILKMLETLVNDVTEIKAVQKIHGEKLDRLESDVATIKRVVCIQSGRLDDLDRVVKIG